MSIWNIPYVCTHTRQIGKLISLLFREFAVSIHLVPVVLATSTREDENTQIHSLKGYSFEKQAQVKGNGSRITRYTWKYLEHFAYFFT
jgi:hypothetical protein